MILSQTYFLTSPPLAESRMSTLKRKPWSSPSRCPLGPHGPQETVPKTMDGSCGWSWSQQVTAPSPWSQELWHILYTSIVTPFFLFSPSSLGMAASKLPPTHTRVHEPLSYSRARAWEHEPKTIPGTVQPYGSLQTSPVYEATALFVGTPGAWVLCGS